MAANNDNDESMSMETTQFEYRAETMDLSVKTLDSKTHEFAALDTEISVTAFKAYISGTVGVQPEQQRLIFRGRVLQDDKKLKDYNVSSGNVIHLVTRTTTSTANDTPPPPQTNTGGNIVMGPGGPNQTIATRRRNSASVRLQVANENLTRASGQLKTLEEEIILLEQASTTAEGQRQNTSLSEEIDNALSASLGPTAAAVVATISETPQPGAPGTGQGGNAQQNQAGSPQNRPSAPMLRDLATSINDYLSLNARLTPYLQTLQRWLNENAELAEGPRAQIQYTYNTLSSILHAVSHTLHALSDITVDFAQPPETRRLRAPASILVGQSTVVRAAIPIGVQLGFDISGMQAMQIPTQGVTQPTPNPTSATANIGSPNVTQPQPNPVPASGAPTPAQQAPQGFPNFLSGLMQGGRIQMNNVQGAGARPAGTGADGGIGQAIAAALQAMGSGGPGGMVIGLSENGSFSPMNSNVGFQLPNAGSFQQNNTSGTNNATAAGAPTQNQQQNINALHPDAQAILGSLNAPHRRPFDLLLQCRSHHHHHPNGQEDQPSRPDDLIPFLVEQRSLTGADSLISEESNVVAETFFNLLQVLNPLRPVIAQYIRSTLLRGRDANNHSHVSTAVRAHVRRLVTWITDPLKPTSDEGRLAQLSLILIEELTRLFAKAVGVILCEPNDTYRITVQFTSLIGEYMPKVRTMFQAAYPDGGHIRVLKGVILMAVNTLFPQSTLVFRTQLTCGISSLLETANYIPDGDNHENEDDHADMEIDVDVQLESPIVVPHPPPTMTNSQLVPNTTHTQQPAPQQAEPLPQVQPRVAPVQIPTVQNEINSDSDGSFSDVETEFNSVTNELFRNVPGGWRNTLLHDIQRQEPLREEGPPSLSPGFLSLFPQK